MKHRLNFQRLIWNWMLRIISLIAVHILDIHAKSTLKVAVCNPGIIPYVQLDNATGTFQGYDVGKFEGKSTSLIAVS